MMTWPWRRSRPGVDRIDRLVVQQYDPRRLVTIGGIDTCLRGVLEYAPPGVSLAVVGVLDVGSADSGPADDTLGVWQKVRRGGRGVWFLPVAGVGGRRPQGEVPR